MGIANQVYWTNGYDPVKVWDGIAATAQNAGITGPAAAIGAPSSTAAGLCDIGSHGIRYRYQNSRTGYVSNPSLAATVVVASGATNALTYNIAASAAPIITSTDAKCDTILIEMTLVSSNVYYQVAQVPNAAGSYVVSIADANLSQNFNSDANFGGQQDLTTFTHSPPPYGTIILGYKGRCWIMGNVPFALTAATFTNGSANVTGLSSTFSQAWVGQAIKKAGDTVAYTIASGSGTSLVLSVNYGGTGSTAAASVYSQTPNRGYYSRAFAPEEFYPAVWARDFLQNRSDILTACIGRKEAMYVFGLFSSERLIYNDDPSAVTSVISPIQGNRGCFNQRCLIEAEGNMYSFDRQGIWMVNEIPVHGSFDVDDALRELVDYSKYQQFHGAYDPVDRIMLFFFVPVGQTLPTMAVCLEIDTGRWFFDQWFQGITSSHIVPTSDGQIRLMLCDANGYSWFFSVDGSFDGVPPTSPTVVTVASASSPTAITVNESLPTTSPTLAGVICYNPLTDLYAVINSNTGNGLTLAAGLVNTPTVGQELWLGPIQVVYQTKWWVGRGQEWKKSPVYLNIRMFPGSFTGVLRVYVYIDFATSPITPTQFPTDAPPDGVTVPPGASYYNVQLSGGINGDGFISVPLIANYSRAIQVKVTSLRPDGALRLAGLDFSMTDESQERSTPGE